MRFGQRVAGSGVHVAYGAEALCAPERLVARRRRQRRKDRPPAVRAARNGAAALALRRRDAQLRRARIRADAAELKRAALSIGTGAI